MQTNVDKIIAAAEATNSFEETGEEPPDEIGRFPAFYQYGREMEGEGLQGGRKYFDLTSDYTCFILVSPDADAAWSELDTLRASFLSQLADQNAIVQRFTSRQYKFMIGGDECFVDQLTVSMQDEITVS